MAVQHNNGGKGVAIVIPAGVEIAATLPDSVCEADLPKLITVQCGGKAVGMFLVDLLERGERLVPVGDRNSKSMP